jgi:hypothetical protein
MPADFEPVDRFFYRHRITPLVAVSDFRRVAGLKDLQPGFIDATGQWKEFPPGSPPVK